MKNNNNSEKLIKLLKLDQLGSRVDELIAKNDELEAINREIDQLKEVLRQKVERRRELLQDLDLRYLHALVLSLSGEKEKSSSKSSDKYRYYVDGKDVTDQLPVDRRNLGYFLATRCRGIRVQDVLPKIEENNGMYEFVYDTGKTVRKIRIEKIYSEAGEKK